MLLATSLRAEASVTIKKIDYHGWKDAYLLTNKMVELVFVPQIGRIMRYGYIGGKNMLYENSELHGKVPDPANLGKDWVNYGGDKLWPAPQSRWGWPPDPTLDRGAQTASISSDKRLIVTGQLSKTMSLQFRREITLASSGTGVTIRNILVNTGKKDVSWSIWEITQVDNPEVVRCPINKNGKFPGGYHYLGDVAPPQDLIKLVGEEVHFRRNSEQTGKFGVDSPLGWIKAEIGNTEFTVSAEYVKNGVYPDGGCPLEVYGNNDPLKYVEMELLAPIKKLAPGTSSTFTTRWRLSNL